MKDAPSLTTLIQRAAEGDAGAADELFAATYSDLRKLARARLTGAPAVRAKLEQVFGLIHQTRWQYALARTALEAALDEQRRLAGPDDPETLESLQALGEVTQLAGDDERARVLLEESLERHRRIYGERHERTARVIHSLAAIFEKRDVDAAAGMLTQALGIRRATLGPTHPDIAVSLSALGNFYYQRGDYIRADDFFRQALAVFPTAEARRNPIAISVLDDLAAVLSFFRNYEAAEALQREAIDIGRQVLGDQTLTVANLLSNHATTAARLGRYKEAERDFRAWFETHRALAGENHWRTRNVQRNVGRSLALQQRYAEALIWMNGASGKNIGDPSGDAGHWGIRAQRAHVRFRLGHREQALAEAAEAVGTLERMPLAEAAWPLALARVLRGRMLNETGQPRDAEPLLVAALGYFERLGKTHPQYAEGSCELARARLLQGENDEERQRLKQYLPTYRRWGLAEREVVSSLDRLTEATPRVARVRTR